ncbi:CCR4-NOT transcription complex, subunit 3, partial [Gonapodya sp. JEL0774]
LHQKLQAASTFAQREKYESELKREIKKLQRLRDQIKAWIASADIKDKKLLTENRMLIEKQMERFKAIERELKTKAYSKEGLSQPGKVDPLDALKSQITTWLGDQLERLSALVDKLE